jgi:hypothetical protein
MPARMRFSHDDYTVAWICALPLEMTAAKTILNKLHHQLYPWDRMNSLNREIQQKGITITYTDPPVTRENWAKTYVPKPT